MKAILGLASIIAFALGQSQRKGDIGA